MFMILDFSLQRFNPINIMLTSINNTFLLYYYTLVSVSSESDRMYMYILLIHIHR